MRHVAGIVVAIGLGISGTSAIHAQYIVPPYYPGYAQYQYSFLQIRTGPNSGFFAYNTNFFRVGPAVPPWYYAPVGMPVPVNPQPPIVIQNIIQPPADAVRDRGFVVPAEFNPARNPVPRPNPAPPKLGPAPPGGRIPLPDAPAPGVKVPGRADADALVEQGRKAFADGQYGRSLELFRKGRDLMPNEASLYFLIGQTQFALGKYPDAVATLSTGMTVRADWPDARFRPRDLYGNAKDFDDHVQLLRQTLATFHDDPGLRFLLGHQLWFDGQRAEAKKLLHQAAQQGSTPAAVFRN